MIATVYANLKNLMRLTYIINLRERLHNHSFPRLRGKARMGVIVLEDRAVPNAAASTPTPTLPRAKTGAAWALPIRA